MKEIAVNSELYVFDKEVHVSSREIVVRVADDWFNGGGRHNGGERLNG
jgi:hypothetical protein